MKPILPKRTAIAEQFGPWQDERDQLDYELDTFEQWRALRELDHSLEDPYGDTYEFAWCAGCHRGNINSPLDGFCPVCNWTRRQRDRFWAERTHKRLAAKQIAADQTAAWLAGQTRAPGWAR